MSELKPSFGFVLAAGLAWLVLAYLVLPLFVVVPVSFTPHRYLSFPDAEWSLRHYRELLVDRTWVQSAWQSFVVATLASGVAVVLGTLCAIGCWRVASRTSEMVRLVMLTPLIVPPIVEALGFYQVWVQLRLLDSTVGLVVAHALKGLPFVIITVSAALVNFDVRLEQAARSLGATPAQSIRLVILPSVAPGMAAGALFAFVLSWDEIVVALFLTGRNVYTLPRKIWDGIQDNISPSVAAVATILVVVTLAALTVHFLLRLRRQTRP